MRNSEVVAVSLPRNMARAVNQKSRQSGLARSEIMRAALLRYLRDEENETMLRARLKLRAQQMRIRDEDDVEELIDSMRR